MHSHRISEPVNSRVSVVFALSLEGEGVEVAPRDAAVAGVFIRVMSLGFAVTVVTPRWLLKSLGSPKLDR
jgi:hypothetical protein